MWFVYIVRCRDGSLYCGISKDIQERINSHNSGKGAKYIGIRRRPVSLVWSKEVEDRSVASRMELYIKALQKKDKERLAKGEKIDHKIAGHDI